MNFLNILKTVGTVAAIAAPAAGTIAESRKRPVATAADAPAGGLMDGQALPVVVSTILSAVLASERQGAAGP